MKMDYYCRLCLKWDSKMYDIFSDYQTKVKMYEIVEKLCDVPVNRHDRLPKWICLNCKNQLIEISNFITVCKESYSRLKCPTYIISVNNQQQPTMILKKTEVTTKPSPQLNMLRNSMPLIKVVPTNKIIDNTKATTENHQLENKLDNMNSPKQSCPDNASSSDNMYKNLKTPVIRVVPKNYKLGVQQPHFANAETPVITMNKTPVQESTKLSPTPTTQAEATKPSDKQEKSDQRPILLDPAIFSNQRNVQASLQKFRKILPKPSSSEMQHHSIAPFDGNQLIAVPIVPMLKPIPVIRKNTCATVVKYLNSQQTLVGSPGMDPLVDIKQEMEEDPLRIEDCDNLMSDAVIKEEVIIPDMSSETDPPDVKKVKKEDTGQEETRQVICDCCKTEFFTKSELRKHLFGDKLKSVKLTCYYCPETFSNLCSRKQHISEIHSDPSQKCPVCQRMFSQQKHLYQHLVTHLQIDSDNSQQQILNFQENFKIAAQGQVNESVDN